MRGSFVSWFEALILKGPGKEQLLSRAVHFWRAHLRIVSPAVCSVKKLKKFGLKAKWNCVQSSSKWFEYKRIVPFIKDFQCNISWRVIIKQHLNWKALYEQRLMKTQFCIVCCDFEACVLIQ